MSLAELLERRRLFSVTVTEDSPGFFEINGDSSDNTITVSVSQVNATFTLDGATYTDVSYLYVNGNGGNDKISVTSSDGPGNIGASIVTGSGNDDITLGVGGGVWAGGGDDTIHVSDSYWADINGEDGNDRIYISGDTIDAQISGGSGDDLIDASNSNVSVTLHGDAGNDTLYGSSYDDELYGDTGNDSISGNAGDDIIYARLSSGDTIDGGDGIDVLYASGSEVSVNYVEYIV
jgi:Ca2+-binding RTX toxin-like protein